MEFSYVLINERTGTLANDLGSWAESEQNRVTDVGTCVLRLHKPLSIMHETPFQWDQRHAGEKHARTLTQTQQGWMGYEGWRGQTTSTADKQSMQKVPWALEGAESGNVRREGSTLSLLLPFPLPFPSALSGVNVEEDIQRPGPPRGAGRAGEHVCLLVRGAGFCAVSVNLKTIEMNKGSNPVGVRRVCTLIQEAKCGSFVICWLMRLWTKGRPLDSCFRQYRRWRCLLDSFLWFFCDIFDG